MCKENGKKNSPTSLTEFHVIKHKSQRKQNLKTLAEWKKPSIVFAGVLMLIFNSPTGVFVYSVWLQWLYMNILPFITSHCLPMSSIRLLVHMIGFVLARRRCALDAHKIFKTKKNVHTIVNKTNDTGKNPSKKRISKHSTFVWNSLLF